MMPEPEAESITGGPTPEAPQDASDVARKIERESKEEPLPEKAKTAATELDREVSGEYEAKQEHDAATDPSTAPPRKPGD
jgi:hypothetical protein